MVSVGGEDLATPVLWDGYTLPLADIVVEARYTAIEYTVVFQDKDGNIIPNTGGTITAENHTIVIPTTGLEPMDGYHPGAWFILSIDGEDKDPAVAFDPNNFPTGNLVIRAIYEPIEYTITFIDTNNGETTVLYFNIRDQKLYNDAGEEVGVPSLSTVAPP